MDKKQNIRRALNRRPRRLCKERGSLSIINPLNRQAPLLSRAKDLSGVLWQCVPF